MSYLIGSAHAGIDSLLDATSLVPNPQTINP
jgi:hypothetical protein